jgi:hypothetical protein
VLFSIETAYKFWNRASISDIIAILTVRCYPHGKFPMLAMVQAIDPQYRRDGYAMAIYPSFLSHRGLSPQSLWRKYLRHSVEELV